MKTWMVAPIGVPPAIANPTLEKWRDMGYETLIHLDALWVGEEEEPRVGYIGNYIYGDYRGWGTSVNRILKVVLAPGDFAVVAAHDLHPDPKLRANKIAAQCTEHFRGTLGVMQPIGDLYGACKPGGAAVSPWIGYDWARRAYGGRGAINEAYPHYYADTELAAVALRLGRYWENSRILQYHDHYLRRGEPTPGHLAKVKDTVAASKRLFEERQAAGFPGSELLEI